MTPTPNFLVPVNVVGKAKEVAPTQPAMPSVSLITQHTSARFIAWKTNSLLLNKKTKKKNVAVKAAWKSGLFLRGMTITDSNEKKKNRWKYERSEVTFLGSCERRRWLHQHVVCDSLGAGLSAAWLWWWWWRGVLLLLLLFVQNIFSQVTD